MRVVPLIRGPVNVDDVPIVTVTLALSVTGHDYALKRLADCLRDGLLSHQIGIQ